MDPKLLEEIKADIEAFQEHLNKYVEKGSYAAGTRARTTSVRLSKNLLAFRKASVKK